MGNNLTPLHYAIVEHFMDGGAECAEGAIRALKEGYGGYKLLNCKAVEEALATAKENGILDEVDCDLDEGGGLRIYYRASDFGKEMMQLYAG